MRELNIPCCVLHVACWGVAAEWDAQGGAPCSSLRQQAAAGLQADAVCWQDVAFAADTLQEVRLLTKALLPHVRGVCSCLCFH